MDDFVFSDASTRAGRIERGRGCADADRNDADSVYRCVIEDSRWDRQVDERDRYLADLIARLRLPVTPLARHLDTAAAQNAEEEDVWLTLDVLALLAFRGRTDAVAVVRRQIRTGRYRSYAFEAVGSTGAWKVPGVIDELAGPIAAEYSDDELAGVAGTGEFWPMFARLEPRIARAVDGRAAATRRPGGATRRPHRTCPMTQ
jgi:hypothetical protein